MRRYVQSANSNAVPSALRSGGTPPPVCWRPRVSPSLATSSVDQRRTHAATPLAMCPTRLSLPATRKRSHLDSWICHALDDIGVPPNTWGRQQWHLNTEDAASKKSQRTYELIVSYWQLPQGIVSRHRGNKGAGRLIPVTWLELLWIICVDATLVPENRCEQAFYLYLFQW